MIRDKASRLLDLYGRNLKLLGIYIAVVLLVFSLALPVIADKIKEEKKTAPAEESNEQYQEEEPVLMREISFADYLVEEEELAPKEEPVIEPEKIRDTPDNSSQTKTEGIIVKGSEPVLAQADIKKIIWPVRGKIIQEQGLSYSLTFSDYRYHDGIDIQTERGTEVVAVLAGVVSLTEDSAAEAVKLVIDHGSGWQSIYAHLEDAYLKKGDTVQAGEAVGHVGQPGLNEILEGPHLHYSLLNNGQVVNPLDYLLRQ